MAIEINKQRSKGAREQGRKGEREKRTIGINKQRSKGAKGYRDKEMVY